MSIKLNKKIKKPLIICCRVLYSNFFKQNIFIPNNITPLTHFPSYVTFSRSKRSVLSSVRGHGHFSGEPKETQIPNHWLQMKSSTLNDFEPEWKNRYKLISTKVPILKPVNLISSILYCYCNGTYCQSFLE